MIENEKLLEQRDSWHSLVHHAKNLDVQKQLSKKNVLFRSNKSNDGALTVDFSKQQVTDETINLLINLAQENSLTQWIERLFAGEKINDTESRPALHHLLRRSGDSDGSVLINSDLISSQQKIQFELCKMSSIVDRINTGQWRGFSGFPIKTVVNIGVGGSDLGPLMGSHALG